MNKRLLILGAGRGQVGLIKCANSMGIQTIVATDSCNYPGIKLANEVCHVDISKPDEVAKAASALKLDGIATCCLDTGIKALGHTCDTLGLFGLSEYSANMCNDKYLMKESLTKAGVSTARFSRIDSLSSLEDAMKKLNFPLIIKAVDLQGSRGIYIVRDKDEARRDYAEVMKLSHESFCIIEEFIEGEEFGAQAFVYNDEVLFVLPHGDITFMSHTAVPVGHFAPYDVTPDIIKATEKAVIDAIHALKLNNCAVNVDLILRDGTVYIIELTGRAGANCLPELVSIYYGIDYYQMIALCAIGEDPRQIFENKAAIRTANLSRMLRSEKSGILKEIINSNSKDDERIYETTFFVKTGDEIRKFTNSNDCVGQVIVKAENMDECNKIMDEVVGKIEFVLE